MSKVMKRVLCICLSAVLVMGVSACGSKKNSDDADDNKAAVEQEQQAEQKEEPEQPEEKEEAPEPYVKGTIEGNHYESAWLNMQADFSEDYVMATEEGIAQLQDAGSGIVDEETQEAIDDAQEAGTSTTEMMVVGLTGDPNCTVAVEKLGFDFNEIQYLEVAKKTLTAGITEEIEIEIKEEMPTVTIAGEEYTCMEATMTMYGINMNTNIYARAKDDYMVIINVTFTDDTAEQKDDLLAAFQPLN